MTAISIASCVAVATGGALGALARFGIGQWLMSTGNPGWIGILAANFLGCALLGTLMGCFSHNSMAQMPYILGFPHDTVKLILMTGFLGALTTYSTFMADIYLLGSQQTIGAALLYSAISLLGGFGLFWLGHKLGHWVISAT